MSDFALPPTIPIPSSPLDNAFEFAKQIAPKLVEKRGVEVRGTIALAMQSLAQPTDLTKESVQAIVATIRGMYADEELAEAKAATSAAVRKELTDSGDAIDFSQLPQKYVAQLQNAGTTHGDLDDGLRLMYPGMPLQEARKKFVEKAKKLADTPEYRDNTAEVDRAKRLIGLARTASDT